MGGNLGPDQFIDRDTVPSRRSKGAARSLRDLEHRFLFPTGCLEAVEGDVEVIDPVDQDWALAVDMIGEEEVRRARQSSRPWPPWCSTPRWQKPESPPNTSVK